MQIKIYDAESNGDREVFGTEYRAFSLKK